MILNELMASACEKLAGRFEECRIYREKIPQGFTRPAFFVEGALSVHEKTLPGRARREYSISVSFFPDGGGTPSIEEGSEAVSELFGELSPGGKAVRCSALRMRVADGVLRAGFSVSVRAGWKPEFESSELMRELGTLKIKA